MVTDAMAVGLVVAPMGWILMLAATVTPQWREFARRPGFPQDVSFSDGLWEGCVEETSTQDKICQPIAEELAVSWPIQLVRALTILSVLLGFLSYVLSHVGARWWAEQPNNNLAGLSGLLLLLSGILYLCATSYMAYRVLADIRNAQIPAEDKYHPGACLYLGWSGGATEAFAGVCLATSFHGENDNNLRNLPAPYNISY